MSDTRSDVDVPENTNLPENQGDAAAPVARSPRDELMARIAERRVAQIEREVGQWESQPQDEGAREHHAATRTVNPSLGEVEEDRVYSGPYAEPDVEGSAGSAAPVEQSERVRPITPPESAAPPAAAIAPQPTTFPIELDGQIIHVTQDQMTYLARMGAIANQALHQYQNTPREQPQTSAPAPIRESAPPPVDDSRISETVRAIQYGDPETAATALKGLISDVVRTVPPAPTFDPNAIVNTAVQESMRRQQLAHDTAVVQQEYADVLSDPIRADAAARQVAMIRQQNIALGRQVSDLEVYREAGNRVRQAFGGHQPTQGQAPAQAGTLAPQAPNLIVRRSVADIEGRKRAAPQRTAAVIDRRSAAPEAPRPPTGSDIVEQMRKARHQSSMR